MKLRLSASVEICILAGGLSRRMGRDKARLKFGRRTMLGEIRATAKSIGLPVRVIRRDVIRRCGPLGGVYTALRTTKAEAVLFLACDMPFVTEELFCVVCRRFGQRGKALFVRSADGVGFPFMLRRDALAMVSAQIERQEFSLHALARRLKAKRLKLPASCRPQLQNVNTPEDLQRARKILGSRRQAKRDTPLLHNARPAAEKRRRRAALPTQSTTAGPFAGS